MAAEAAEVLEEWRRAERLLHALPDDAPDRSDIEVHVEQLRILYQRVTSTTIPSTEYRLSTRRQIARSRSFLDTLSEQYGSDASPRPA